MLPAIGQGALGLEASVDNSKAISALKKIDDAKTHAEVIAERALLRHLRAGCLAPVGAFATHVGKSEIELGAAVLSRDGTERIFHSRRSQASAAADLGVDLAEQMINDGADKLLARSE